MRLLVVEDEPFLRATLVMGLQEEGYIVDAVGDGEQAVYQAAQTDYDLLLLDLNLPRLNGLAVCAQLRGLGSQAKVLMVTARDGVHDKIAGLDAGADDYLVKPFVFEELLARLRALARRGSSSTPVLQCADLSLNPATGRVSRGGKILALSAREYALLEVLMRHPDEILSRLRIAQAIMPDETGLDSNVLDVFVSYLRGKVDKPFKLRLIHTVRGMGYVLRVPKA